MKWSVPVGRVFGIPIRIHLTFLLLLAWIAWLGWRVNGLSSSLWALALILSLFLCVVLHELGHSFVAIRFGAEVRSVTLLPIGGVASMKSIPEKPYQEFLVSLAGPAVNVIIVVVLSLWRGEIPWGIQIRTFPAHMTELIDAMIRANIVITVFNLIPAFPMDGGRILRSLLALFLPYPQATAIAALLGQVLGVLFVMIGLFYNPLLALIGFFIFIGADSEERFVRIKDVLRDVLVEDVMVTDFVSLQPDDAVGRCLEFVYHRRQEDFPVEHEGKLVGILPRKEWLIVLHRSGVEARVEDVMTKRFISIHPKTRLARFYQDLMRLNQGVFPVIDNGRLVGLLNMEDVGRFLMVQEAQKGNHRNVHPVGTGGGNSSRLTIDMG